MAEIALLSNMSSSLYASSKSSGGSDTSSYIYDMKQSGINKFTEKFIRTPLNNPSFGGNCQCNIPSFGVLRQMVLKTTISYNIKTNAQTPIVAKALFAELIDQVSLKNSSRELQVVYGDCIKYLVYNLGAEKSKKWKILGKDDLLIGDVNMLNSTAANAYTPRRPSATIGTSAGGSGHTIDVYTVLPFSMFADFGSDKHTPFKNLLNTRFVENLQIDVKYNPRIKAITASAAVDADNGFTTEPTISASELICCFDIIQDKELAAIEAANYSLSQPLALVLGNWNKRRSTVVAAAAGKTDFEVQLFNTDLAHSLLITCKKVNTATQLEALGKAVNIPSCNIATTHVDAIGTNVCSANAQFTEGYGTAVAEEKHDIAAVLGAGALANANASSLGRIFLPFPPTNKHCIPHDCDVQLTDANDGVALDLRASQATALANGVGVSRQGADHMTLSSISLTSAGRELYKAENHLEALYLGNSEMKGCCWFDDTNHRVGEDADLQDQNGCSPYNMYLIPFGDDNNLDAIRGMLSMKNLNSVKLSVGIENCVAGATYEVNVYVRKYSAISIEASSGRISTAVST